MPGPWLSPNRGFPVFRFARGPRQGLIWPVGCCVAMWGRGGACFPFLALAWKTYVLHVAVYVPRVSPTYETCVFAADIRFFQEADMRLVRHTKHMFCIPGHARHTKHMSCMSAARSRARAHSLIPGKQGSQSVQSTKHAEKHTHTENTQNTLHTQNAPKARTEHGQHTHETHRTRRT